MTAVNKTVAHEALLSAEQTARQELTEMMEKQRVEAHCEKEKLLLEVHVYTCTCTTLSIAQMHISFVYTSRTENMGFAVAC